LAALGFIPAEKLVEDGYYEFVALFRQDCIELRGGDGMGDENGMTIYQVFIYVASISIVLFSTAVAASQTNQLSMKKTTAVDPATEHKSGAIPLIDRAAPVAYETATFGLG